MVHGVAVVVLLLCSLGNRSLRKKGFIKNLSTLGISRLASISRSLIH